MATNDRDLTAEKYEDEIIDQGVDFATILGGSDTISSGAVTAKTAAGTDVTASMIPGGASVNGSQVTYRLVAWGTAGTKYYVFVVATLNTTEEIGQRITLTILPN